MSKKILFIFFLTSLLIISCAKKSELAEILDCYESKYNNLETVNDVKGKFTIDLPKHWKINLYQDEVQSSIFAADTTKQLTATVLLDVTYINNKINFNEAFLLKQEQENLAKSLIKTKSKEIIFLEKPSLLMQFKGVKGKFPYQVSNLFIKLNSTEFILAKTEVYGDSLVNQRFCRAFSLIEKMNIKE